MDLTCPHCKKYFNPEEPIETLRLHIQKNINISTIFRARVLHNSPENDHGQARLDKWKGWADALDNLIKIAREAASKEKAASAD